MQLGYSLPMTVNTNSSATAAVAPMEVALHWGFSDLKSSLRLPLPLPPALRTALTAQLLAHGGVLDGGSQGLSSFHASVAQAVQAAVAILATGTALLLDETAPLALRAVLVGVDGSGESARGAALARAGRVLPFSRDQTLLLSRNLYQQLDKALSERARLAVSPRGADQHPDLDDLFDLDWKAAALRAPEVAAFKAPEVTVTPPAPTMTAPVSVAAQLALTYGGNHLRIASRDCPVTLGRAKSCTLHLDDDIASRRHGSIEFVQDRFYFVDDSRNGSYLMTPQGAEVFLHRERLPLLGHGVISPGTPIVKQTGKVVHYTCCGSDAADGVKQ